MGQLKLAHLRLVPMTPHDVDPQHVLPTCFLCSRLLALILFLKHATFFWIQGYYIKLAIFSPSFCLQVSPSDSSIPIKDIEVIQWEVLPPLLLSGRVGRELVLFLPLMFDRIHQQNHPDLECFCGKVFKYTFWDGVRLEMRIWSY